MKEQDLLQYPADFLHLISEGLKPARSPKRIMIIGAGLAGLTAGSLLKAAGHDVSIFEANERVGGRVYTIRKPFSEGNYLNVGAMRIPNYHHLVHAYLQKFGLSTHPFINETPEDILFINQVRTSRKIYEENPDILEIPLPSHEKGKTAEALFKEAVQPFLDQYTKADTEEKKALQEAYKNFSIAEFLLYNPIGPSLSRNAVYLIGIMLGIESFPHGSFTDVIIDLLEPLTKKNTSFQAINHGNDWLPYSFYKELHNEIYFHQKITAIDQSNTHFVQLHTNQHHTFTGDLVISTVPFPLFQYIDISPASSISFDKTRFIRTFTHVPSLKIGMEFHDRFWEELHCGNAISDLSTRFSFIPSQKGVNVMIASYSWGDGTLLWTSTSPNSMCQYALNELAKLYGSAVHQTFKQMVYFNWSLNPYSAGCFSLLTPLLGAAKTEEIIRQPEDRIHFAGDYASNFNGWMEGAIESGIRSAFEINGVK